MQSYRQGDRAGAVDRWLTAVFAPGYRQLLDHLFRGSWEQAVQDADMFFGIEVPELQRWQFGTAEAARINLRVLSMVGSESDPAFFEMEELLRGLLPQLADVICLMGFYTSVSITLAFYDVPAGATDMAR